MFVAADQAVPAEDEAGAVRGYSHRVPAPRTEPLQARASSHPCQLKNMDILFVLRMGIKASHLRRLQFGLYTFMSIWILLCH
jgi:hypothetical protein